MAAAGTSGTLPASDPDSDLIKEIRRHEVAIAELNSLPSSRPVYQKNGNIFFRTTMQKVTASEQSKEKVLEAQLDFAKRKLQKANTK